MCHINIPVLSHVSAMSPDQPASFFTTPRSGGSLFYINYINGWVVWVRCGAMLCRRVPWIRKHYFITVFFLCLTNVFTHTHTHGLYDCVSRIAGLPHALGTNNVHNIGPVKHCTRCLNLNGYSKVNSISSFCPHENDVFCAAASRRKCVDWLYNIRSTWVCLSVQCTTLNLPGQTKGMRALLAYKCTLRPVFVSVCLNVCSYYYYVWKHNSGCVYGFVFEPAAPSGPLWSFRINFDKI